MPFALAALLGDEPRPGFRQEIPGQRELFEWPCIWDIDIGGLNLCVNRVVLLEFLAMVVVAVFFMVAFRRPRVVPGGAQNVMEGIYDYITRDIVHGVLGTKGLVWQPYLMALFLFVFVLSLFEVIPGLQFPLSSRIAVPLFLALGSWTLYHYAGIREKGFRGYIKDTLFPSGVPWFAYPILTPIEFATAMVLRPFTLAIRLFANFFAGHYLLVVFFVGAAYLLAQPLTIPFALGAVLMSVFLVGLEIFIAAVQAYVFTILTAVYISLSVSHDH
jgi:F-type H+-transporting ATPase subunit a